MVPEEIADIVDIKEAVKARLLHSGTWNDLQARIRAEIFHTINDKSVTSPEKSHEMTLANDIIIDYLNSICLPNSLSVFKDESGQSEINKNRDDLGLDLGLDIIENEADVPILLLIIKKLLSEKKTRDVHRNTASQTPQDI